MEITFAAEWWHTHYGMDFGRDAWLDPIARAERAQRQARLLFEGFDALGLGEETPEPKPNLTAYGDRFMAALWGCSIEYRSDQAPAAMVLPDAGKRMRNLKQPVLDDSPIVQRAFADAEILKERYGHCDGAINFGGPLNNAVSVFGEEILAACIAEPELARNVLHMMAETVLAVHDQVTCVINGATVSSPRPLGCIGNCPVCMISPNTYRDVVLQADQWLRQQFQEFSLHHCGVFHPYAGVYQELRPDHLDIGWGTDLRATRCVYPDTPMSLEIQASAVVRKSRAEIDTIVKRMIDDAGPAERITYLWVAEAGSELSDETVCDLLTSPERVQV